MTMKLTEFLHKAPYVLVAIQFPHRDFEVNQFGFGSINLKKGERSLVLDTNEGKVEWSNDGDAHTLLVGAFIEEEADGEQDLLLEDARDGLDTAEIFIEEGYGEWEVDVIPISAKLCWQGNANDETVEELVIPLELDVAISSDNGEEASSSS